MINRYYVGAKHIGSSINMGGNADCTRATFEEALADAQQQLDENPHQKAVVIVRITHVVRRAKHPIEIQELD